MSIGGPCCQWFSAKLAMKHVCRSISTRPAEGTLNISTLLGEQVQMMQKHSVHPISEKVLQVSF